MSGQSKARHLTVQDLAEREGVSVETIYFWNRTGNGPRYMKIGRYPRYREADVVAWETSRYVRGTGATA